MEVYKITLKIELGYNDTVTYDGKDLAIAAALIAMSQNKLNGVKKKEVTV